VGLQKHHQSSQLVSRQGALWPTPTPTSNITQQ
jgi:hypothetical protein